MANKWLLWLGWSEPVRTGVVDVSPSGITGMISVGRDSTKGGGGYGVKVWCIQSLDKCFGFGVREDEHSWRFFEQHSRGMLGIAGESCISSLSQGCAVIFVKQKSSLDQSMWLQLPRDLWVHLPRRKVLGQVSLGALESTADVHSAAILLREWSHVSTIFIALSISLSLPLKRKTTTTNNKMN